MKTKFKLLTCAIAAAVLSTGAVAAAAIIPGSSWTSDKEKAREEAVRSRETSEWYADFEEALLEGRSVIDPPYAADNGLTDNNEIMPVYLETAAPASTDVRLTLVHGEEGYGYNLWSGRFVVDDVSAFASKFTEPDTMNCILYAGTKGQLEWKNYLSVNYKMLAASYTYLENDRRVTLPTVTKEGTGTLPAVISSYNGSGKLIEKVYYFYMYRGAKYSDFYEVAVIHVVDKDYAETEEYAALPYGNLIDCYTYVDTESMGVVPPAKS